MTLPTARDPTVSAAGAMAGRHRPAVQLGPRGERTWSTSLSANTPGSARPSVRARPQDNAAARPRRMSWPSRRPAEKCSRARWRWRRARVFLLAAALSAGSPGREEPPVVAQVRIATGDLIARFDQRPHSQAVRITRAVPVARRSPQRSTLRPRGRRGAKKPVWLSHRRTGHRPQRRSIASRCRHVGAGSAMFRHLGPFK